MLFNTCIIENWTVCQSSSNLKSKSKQIFCHIFWFRPKTWITKSSISKINFSGRHENSYFSVSLISFNLSWIRRVRRWVQPIFSRGSLAFSPSPRSRSHKYFYGSHRHWHSVYSYTRLGYTLTGGAGVNLTKSNRFC